MSIIFLLQFFAILLCLHKEKWYSFILMWVVFGLAIIFFALDITETIDVRL